MPSGGVHPIAFGANLKVPSWRVAALKHPMIGRRWRVGPYGVNAVRQNPIRPCFGVRLTCADALAVTLGISEIGYAVISRKARSATARRSSSRQGFGMLA